jgi:hypothetical protein
LLAYAASVAEPNLLRELTAQDIDIAASQEFSELPLPVQKPADRPFRPLEGHL